MIINCAREFKGLAKVANSLVNGSSKASSLLRDATLDIGLASDPSHGVPASAVQTPTFVGDCAVKGKTIGANAELLNLLEKNSAMVNVKPVYNPSTGRYDMALSKNVKYTGDAGFIGDSGADLIGMQTVSPWNASYFEEVYRQPLLYSHARDLVKRKSSSNPWGETQALQLAGYSGWGQLGSAGTVGANLKKNVNIQSGLMVSSIINIKVYFNFTAEEMQRAEGGNGSPFAGSLMAEKQKYAQYVLDMITDYLTYYGNDATDTKGLFDINGETTWSSDSLSAIKSGSSTTKGNAMYNALAGAITDFMDNAYNKFDVIKVAMSPLAYNILTSTPYSDVYNPKSPLAIFEENFNAGVTKSGSKASIEFYSDPLLSANTDFSSDGNDRLVITAPEVGAGTTDDKQDILLLGVPLENFVYPVYPNSYDQQHCILRRTSGVFAPVPQAVKVYNGFGVKA